MEHSERIDSIETAFKLAIREAKKGAAFVSPNPLVGCVIVDSAGLLLSAGYHAKYGGPHAEIEALNKLTTSEQLQRLNGATVYVTLEPCAHVGKTGSCAVALSKLPIKKVIYGLQDPNPLVSGKGAEILRQAGIETQCYDEGNKVQVQAQVQNDLLELCEIFLKNMTQKKIFIAAKVASTLDGQIATRSGESKWITGPEARQMVHRLRAEHDAILVGRRTIELDDPSLDIRYPQIQKENALIILDPEARLLGSISAGRKFKFMQARPLDKIYFAVRNSNEFVEGLVQSLKIQVINFSSLDDLHAQMWTLGLRSLFIEGGAQTYSNYLQAGLIDRLHLFLAPSILGAANGLSWTKGLLLPSLAEKRELKNIKAEMVAMDLYLTGRFK